MLGFKFFRSASAILEGIGVAQMVRKKRFNSEASRFQQFAIALLDNYAQSKG